LHLLHSLSTLKPTYFESGSIFVSSWVVFFFSLSTALVQFVTLRTGTDVL